MLICQDLSLTQIILGGNCKVVVTAATSREATDIKRGNSFRALPIDPLHPNSTQTPTLLEGII